MKHEKDEKSEKDQDVQNLEVEPLSDEDLETASGGLSIGKGFDDCSCTDTGGNCTS